MNATVTELICVKKARIKGAGVDKLGMVTEPAPPEKERISCQQGIPAYVNHVTGCMSGHVKRPEAKTAPFDFLLILESAASPWDAVEVALLSRIGHVPSAHRPLDKRRRRLPQVPQVLEVR